GGFAQGGYGSFGAMSSSRRRSNRGPQGYTRSDERIKEDISDRLMEVDWIDVSHVVVEVRDGEVTLSGNADDRREKYLIEDITDSVLGVKDVHNQLRVRREDEHGDRDQSNRSE